jgi:predicted molibdopterin-dependent oxidoreductase YjgC
VVTPPGEAMPDWEILDRLATKLGYPSRYGSVEKIRAEITRFVPMYGGLNGAGSAWVKQTSGKRLYSKENEGPLLSFAPVSLPQEDSFDRDYPALAILGSHRHHLGSGTRTDCSERMRSFGLKGEVEISPSLAAELDLRPGDPVRIASRSGSILRQVRVQEGLESNLIFLPTGFQSNDVQRLMELTPLGEPHSSSWKTCRVRLEKTG